MLPPLSQRWQKARFHVHIKTNTVLGESHCMLLFLQPSLPTGRLSSTPAFASTTFSIMKSSCLCNQLFNKSRKALLYGPCYLPNELMMHALTMLGFTSVTTLLLVDMVNRQYICSTSFRNIPCICSFSVWVACLNTLYHLHHSCLIPNHFTSSVAVIHQLHLQQCAFHNPVTASDICSSPVCLVLLVVLLKDWLQE